MKQLVAQRKTLFLVVLVFLFIGSLYFVEHNEHWYDETIVQVVKVERLDEEFIRDEHRNEDMRYTERLEAVVLNGKNEGNDVSFTNEYSDSGAYDYPYKEGDKIFVTIDERGEEVAPLYLKRDRYVVWMMWAFVFVLLIVGRRQGLLSMISFFINATILYVGLDVFIQFDRISLLFVASILAVIFTISSLLFVSGFQTKTYVAILTTLIGTLVTMLVVTFVLWMTKERGIYYEEMQFLTRPYFVIFLASLLIGLLGAVMDVAITMASSVFELFEKNPAITMDALKEAGRDIGRDVMGTITSILFFAYMSGSIPMILLYVMNDVPLNYALPINLSLELARALAGGIGIVLSIPLSLYISVWFARRKQVIR